MWRSFAIGVVLAGCDWTSGSAGSQVSAGTGWTAYPATLPDKARAELARIRVRYLVHVPPVGALRCVEADGVAVCKGGTKAGDRLVAKFHVDTNGGLGQPECVGWGDDQDWAGWAYHLHRAKLGCPAS